MRKISNHFFINYIFMFFLSLLVIAFFILAIGFTQHVITENLMKNIYTANDLMKDNYKDIDVSGVLKNNGGVQIIDENYRVIMSKGLNNLHKNKYSLEEFTDFLTSSDRIGLEYHYDIKYNPKGKFWLIVTFPTSLRIDFQLVYNKSYESHDMRNVSAVLISSAIFCLLMLAVITAIYSRISSFAFVNPLNKLNSSIQRFKEGDYSSRVEYKLKNEFGELQETFNEMAQQIQNEIALRKQSEETRKKLILDISHDLKNPLASIMGYSELIIKKPDLSNEDILSHAQIIYQNSIRANTLIMEMFELSKLESPDYKLDMVMTDICEFVREELGSEVSTLDKAGFQYDVITHEEELFVMLDKIQMSRVFHNLISNTIKFNTQGTLITVEVSMTDDDVIVLFKDNGIGISKEIAKDIFQPFVRADRARNSQTGGTGLGLAIVERIVVAHGGSISLNTDIDCGCAFIIKLPKASRYAD